MRRVYDLAGLFFHGIENLVPRASRAPAGFKPFITAMPIRLEEKLFLKTTSKRELAGLGDTDIKQWPKLTFSHPMLLLGSLIALAQGSAVAPFI